MRFGLGWRAELGAGIIAHLDRIDVLEVLAEDFFEATRDQRKALRFLRTQVPIVLHGTSLGLASTAPVDRKRLDAIARVIAWLEPESWSEHLAFVRAGGTEVGHLAAPPRNDATLAGLVRNVEEARRVTGSLPLLENVASLIEPPLCSYDEESWLHAVLAATSGDLLLDLHNVYANGVNFGFDSEHVVRSLPGDCVGGVHLAGGRRVERGRVLDDHLHGVPNEVFALLSCVNATEANVILERDGNYPPIEVLLEELDRARDVIRSVERGSWAGAAGLSLAPHPPRSLAHARDDIAFLAQLYTDEAARARFFANPEAEARSAGFNETEARDVARMNLDDLRLAARGFEKKRAAKARSRESPSRTPHRKTSRA
ncbi:MAG TPA: DUF692 family protein [Thermoanaerobaculia bacterium]|jgi:uncharacterized protein (UPF0276 family)|nr:DUF692 family protein [Thermoanaerobaculia bacterium]